MKSTKQIAFFIFYYFISILGYQNLFAQDETVVNIVNDEYEILRNQIDVYNSYFRFNENQARLLAQADSLNHSGEYEIGLIYLEELLESINSSDVNLTNDRELNNVFLSKENFSLSFISGIDYDRHEFEFGYQSNDSTILEELNKPYVGLTMDYHVLSQTNNQLSLYNSLRYDKENIRNNYQIDYNLNNINLEIGGYINKSENSSYSSYWENYFHFNYINKVTERFSLNIRNNYHYKVFDKSDFSYTDYFRNYFESGFEYNYSDYLFVTQYKNEINEYLGNQNYDYVQNILSVGYRRLNNPDFRHSGFVDYEIRDYEIIYNDSTLSNIYNQLSLLVDFNFKLFKSLSFQVENHFYFKAYQNQNTIDSDYFWNYLEPGFGFNLSSNIQLELGYEWETKIHSSTKENDISFNEQDYESNGIHSSFNYFNDDLLSLTMTCSYQWRRYPKTPANQILNFYSSRNILSLIALANLPITKRLSANILILYDNDKDVDSDQGNTQSSIYNFEIKYDF